MSVSRRSLLVAGVVGALATGCSPAPPRAPALVGPGAGGSAADAVTGAFDVRRAAGTTLHVALQEDPEAGALQEDLATFTRITGIAVEASVLPGPAHFSRVTEELVSGLSTLDVFAAGAPMVWQYGPAGWMEDLDPWLANASATGAAYDPDDVLPQMRAAMRWDGTMGQPVGTGPLWGLPWTWQSAALTYRADVLARLGAAAPQSLGQLEEVAEAAHRLMAAEAGDQGYGLAVRGARAWDTVQSGFATQYAREGGEDYTEPDGHLVPAVDSEVSVDFHRRWAGLVGRSGPSRWTEYTNRNCSFDLGQGRAAMMYDATSAALLLDRPGGSPAAGRLAWSPGPAGAGGDLTSDLSVVGLAISSRSQQKLAAWLFLQWATGRQHASAAALRGSADPVRRSVLTSPAFRDARAAHAGYLDTLDSSLATARVLSTPRPAFLDSAVAWAEALQAVVAGDATRQTLDTLATRMRRRG